MRLSHYMSRIVRGGCVALFTIAASSCGVFLVHGPTVSGQTRSSQCTEGNTGPILDVVAAGLSGALTVVAATQWNQGDSYFYYVSDEFTYGGIAGAVLYGASSVIGFQKTKQCRTTSEPVPMDGLQGIQYDPYELVPVVLLTDWRQR